MSYTQWSGLGKYDSSSSSSMLVFTRVEEKKIHAREEGNEQLRGIAITQHINMKSGKREIVVRIFLRFLIIFSIYILFLLHFLSYISLHHLHLLSLPHSYSVQFVCLFVVAAPWCFVFLYAVSILSTRFHFQVGAMILLLFIRCCVVLSPSSSNIYAFYFRCHLFAGSSIPQLYYSIYIYIFPR